MLGRLVKPEDFRRVLAQRAQVRSTHFALHHLAEGPLVRFQPGSHRLSTELSTGPGVVEVVAVDDPPAGNWLGLVVPKRHARRSVTRSLIKRQMRQAVQAHAEALAPGMLVLRLTTAFAVAQFPSAASPALRQAVRAELTQLFQRGRRAGPHA
ncbi:MAG: ribonuclease P protein component [Aquabacterium sp.]